MLGAGPIVCRRALRPDPAASACGRIRCDGRGAMRRLVRAPRRIRGFRRPAGRGPAPARPADVRPPGRPPWAATWGRPYPGIPAPPRPDRHRPGRPHGAAPTWAGGVVVIGRDSRAAGVAWLSSLLQTMRPPGSPSARQPRRAEPAPTDDRPRSMAAEGRPRRPPSQPPQGALLLLPAALAAGQRPTAPLPGSRFGLPFPEFGRGAGCPPPLPRLLRDEVG